jgi:glyoxylase-like metal-dependent hydrolase (beta-lactamase superfamily II)
MNIWLKFLSRVFLITVLGCCGIVSAQEKTLKITEIKNNFHVISGDGGNVAVFIGEDGTFLIDDNFGKHAKKIDELIKSVNGDTPKFLVNTHFHGDHTGGNAYFGEKGTIIVAHHNVRKRLQEGFKIKAFKVVALPVSGPALPKLTYAESVDIYLNDETIKLLHLPNAHTDTDTVVYFKNANIVHLGDLMFNGFFPFIDSDHKGSLKGVISALKTAKQFINEDTVIIPGHGPIASLKDLDATIETLTTAYERLNRLKASGLSMEQAIAKTPLADIEKRWGGVTFNAKTWISIVWQGL